MNSRYFRPLFTVVVAALLSACGGGAASNESGTSASSPTVALAEQIKSLEASGQLPKLDRSADIRGPDNDNNGIRDDIDAWIAAQPITDEQKRAARQSARVTQKQLLANLLNPTSLQSLAEESAASVVCLSNVFEPDYQKGLDLSAQIEAVTANTKHRAKQYLAYNRARSGSSGRLPEENACEP